MRPSYLSLCALFCSIAMALSPQTRAATTTNDYAAVDALFTVHCLDCHAAQEPEGRFVMETYAALMKGGESGAALIPGNSSDSLLVKMIEGRFEKDGKKKTMPPGKRKKLAPEEIAVIRHWIDAGALASTNAVRILRDLVLPKIAPTAPLRRSIQALASAPGLKLLAVARYGEVELLSPDSRAVTLTLHGHRGAVNALAFTADGRQLVAAAGDPGRFGEVRLWNVADSSLVRVFEGHTDALYAVALSPDGRTLASGSYDQKIKLWEVATGKELQTLSAHNGGIFALAFRPDGKILASASGDRTVKLWNVATGKRIETLSQPLKEQFALAWTPDGQRLVAGGADNRIRVWAVSSNAAETTNPLLLSKFAHEGAILNLRFSPDGKALLSSADDRTVKLWNAADMTEKFALELQPDVPPGLAFLGDDQAFAVGRLDGTVEFYEGKKGQRLPMPAPGLSRLEPRGLQHGLPTIVTLFGTNLLGVTNISASHTQLFVTLLRVTNSSQARMQIEAAVGLPRGPYELAARGPGGESGKVKIYVDDLPQRMEARATNVLKMPFNLWGVVDKAGAADEFRFEAKAGQTVVLDLAVKSVGSRLTNGFLSLLDAQGAVLASDSGFDGGDRFLAHTLPSDGIYLARVADQMLGASKEHFYRLTLGALPYVTGVFPLSVGTNLNAELELAGFNLPAPARVNLKTDGAGEREVPIDAKQFRSRGTFKIMVAEGAQLTEREPNDTPAHATMMNAPVTMNGRIGSAGDTDLFRFEAIAGALWILETDAARRGSPVDTRLAVLHPDGKPVARVLLQGVRNTQNNFRPFSSDADNVRLDNYEEMELREYLYMNGDVMRLFRMPQGPDSDMLMVTSAGKRRAYFDTTAVAHALDEQGFLVEPRPPGTKLPATGLPNFTLSYENDDDGGRRLGRDSRLHFTAPTNGPYLVRVTDTSGHGGDRFAYRLIAREARPDFNVTLSGLNTTISPGSGQSFTLNAERVDGFEDEIRVELTGLPEGFSVATPIIIEAEQVEAKGSFHAAFAAPKPGTNSPAPLKISATATVNGKPVTKAVKEPGALKRGEAPKLYVSLTPYVESATNHFDPAAASSPLELTIAPGATIPAWLKIHRHGHNDLVTFFAENLPHGVIVADIGLNGVLIPKGESERQIFFSAARWVPEQDRLFHMIEQQAGRQTSRPVLLKVRKSATKPMAGVK